MSSRRIATRSLRRKMATSPSRAGRKPSPASILPTSRGQCTPWNSPEAQLLVRGFGERSQHRLEHSEHEAGFALQWDEVILFVHTGRWNAIGARVGSDNGFCRKRLLIGDARKSDRRNQYAEGSRAGVDRQVSRDGY